MFFFHWSFLSSSIKVTQSCLKLQQLKVPDGPKKIVAQNQLNFHLDIYRKSYFLMRTKNYLQSECALKEFMAIPFADHVE